MPCIKVIGGVKIYIYSRDHNPPHFHVLVAEYEELIEIKTLKTYTGSIPSKYRKKVIIWAEQNKDYLMNNWKSLNR